MIRQLARHRTWHRLSLFFDFGHCPAGCRDGSVFHGPTSRVYRSSWRSVTLECFRCGLRWTMTVHQLAKVATRLAADCGPDEHDHRQRSAQAWAEWATEVNDQRGRRPKQTKRKAS